MDQTKKSSAVQVTLLAAFATTFLAGCSSGHREVRRCVDDKGKVMDDQYCESTYYRASPIYGYPRFVYGGSGGWTPGSTARGFSANPLRSDSEIVTGSGRVIRGGFGGSSSGSRGFFGGFG